MNDLETVLSNKSCNGVNIEFKYDDITFYLKLFVLLYVDDTVVFGTDEKEFQKNLDMFFEYSELWHLNINYDKSKIIIFGTRRDKHFDFHFGGHQIDNCKDFKNLGGF